MLINGSTFIKQLHIRQKFRTLSLQSTFTPSLYVVFRVMKKMEIKPLQCILTRVVGQTLTFMIAANRQADEKFKLPNPCLISDLGAECKRKL